MGARHAVGDADARLYSIIRWAAKVAKLDADAHFFFETRFGHRRRHVYRAGIGVPALKMTASARAFQRCVARAYILTACVVMAHI